MGGDADLYCGGMTPFLLSVLVGLFLTVRVTRIVTTDQITEPPRLWLIDRLGPDNLLVYLVHCQWCMSIWVGAGAAAGAVLLAEVPDGLNPVWVGAGLTAAYSWVTGALAERVGVVAVGGEA